MNERLERMFEQAYVKTLEDENVELLELMGDMVDIIKMAQNQLAFLHANDGRFGFAETLNAIKEVLVRAEEVQ